jgi:CopG family nickel-responsive transcriptional regulator
MHALVRFGVSIDARLLTQFDGLIAAEGYTNRSEALRDLIRDRLVAANWEQGETEVIGTITVVYRHDMPALTEKLIALQHAHQAAVISTLHVHLDHHHCLEVLVVRGQAKEIKTLADHLIGIKGVKHGKLTTTTTGTSLF